MDDILGLLGQGIRSRGGLLGAFLPMSEAEREEQRRKQLQAQYLQEQMAQMQFTRQQAQAQAQAQLMAQQEAQRKAQEAAAQQARMADAARDPYAMFRKSGPAPKWTVADALKAQMEAAAGDPAAIDKLSEAYKRISDVDQPEYGMTLTAGVGPDGKPAFLQPSKRGGAQVVRGAAPQQESPLGKVSPGDFDPASLKQFLATGDYSVLRPIDKRPQTTVSVTNDLAPKLPKDYRWKDGKVGQEVEPIPGGPADTSKEDAKRAAYSSKSRDVVLELIDTALPQIGHTTTGVGSAFDWVPGSPPANFRALIDPIKANIGFDRLQEMREASKTGGALGQVAVQEINYLQATLGSLDRAQSPEQFRESLLRVRKHYKRATELIARIQAGERSTGASGDFDDPLGIRQK